MLLANILIAEHLHQYCMDKTLLRVHPDVNDEKKVKLKEFFDKVGLSWIDMTDS
jgi:exoribonuclease R